MRRKPCCVASYAEGYKDGVIEQGSYAIGWLNVGISYPECDVNVLLTDGSKVGFGYRVENARVTHWRSHQDLGWVTHWMPLPEAPNE